MLRVKYNDVQFKHEVLHTEEFGYKRKEPEPKVANIMSDEYILGNDMDFLWL